MLRCIECGKENEQDRKCECGGLLEVVHEFGNVNKKLFENRKGSGVWRYKELVHPELPKKYIVSMGEGNTNIYENKKIEDFVRIKLKLKHEGQNPTGSFKDRGMSVGVSEAMRLGKKVVACASTGNTSASMAAYAAFAGIKARIFIPKGKIALGKLAQALAYGAEINQVEGSFDLAMQRVQEQDAYILNSINPWRLEGQKTIMIELLHQLNWEPPDWVAVPGGNLGNTSAFAKAFKELEQLDIIEKIPKLAVIQAEGANPFYRSMKKGVIELVDNPETIATAIRIGRPVNIRKAIRAIEYTKGVVEQVTDQEIMDAKKVVDGCGIGCEPASAASVAGVKKLVERGIIKKGEVVVGILTGNILKDPEVILKQHS